MRAHSDPEDAHLDEDGEPFHAVAAGIGLRLELHGVTDWVASDTTVLAELEEVTADVSIPRMSGYSTMGRQDATAFPGSVDPELGRPAHSDTVDAVERAGGGPHRRARIRRPPSGPE